MDNSQNVQTKNVNENRFIQFFFILLFVLFIIVIFFATTKNYPGQLFHYVHFSILLNGLLFAGFRKKRVFFDTFIGLFFWLGFWLKFSLRMIFFKGAFNEVVGHFGFLGPDWDQALTISSCGIAGLLVASFCREKFLFSYSKELRRNGLDALFSFYRNYRGKLLIGFCLLVVICAGSNFYLGIYQRGTVPRTILPYGLGGIYTWLLLFGLSSFSAIILDFEFRFNKNPYLVSTIILLESFLSNVSLLSRGMILNVSALALGANATIQDNILSRFKFKAFFVLAFGLLFVGSIFAVNLYRSYHFFNKTVTVGEQATAVNLQTASVDKPQKEEMVIKERKKNFVNLTKTLFIDRFVGIEGVMAVSSYPKLGWDIWNLAWKEKYLNSGTSLYDQEIMRSPYAKLVLNEYHFISLPGILAFFFYPGSFLFLFFAMFVLGIAAASLEYLVYWACESNFILCSLIAQVIAYRFSNFGYVPAQSYLLLGTILLNVVIIKYLNKGLCTFKRGLFLSKTKIPHLSFFK